MCGQNSFEFDMPAGVNYINVKHTNISFGRSFSSFFLWYICTYIHRKKLPKRHSYEKRTRLTLMKLTPIVYTVYTRLGVKQLFFQFSLFEGHKIWWPKSIVLDYVGINLSVHHFWNTMYFLDKLCYIFLSIRLIRDYIRYYSTLCRPIINKLDYLLIAGNIFDRHKYQLAYTFLSLRQILFISFIACHSSTSSDCHID